MSKKHKKSSSHQSGVHGKQGQKPNHQSSAPHRKLPSAVKHAQPKPQNTVKQTQPSPYQITLAEDSDEDVSQIPEHQIQNQPAGTEGDDDEATGLTKLQSNLAAKLTGSRFRVLNEELYTTTSEEVRMNEVNNDNSTFSFWLSEATTTTCPRRISNPNHVRTLLSLSISELQEVPGEPRALQ